MKRSIWTVLALVMATLLPAQGRGEGPGRRPEPPRQQRVQRERPVAPQERQESRQGDAQKGASVEERRQELRQRIAHLREQLVQLEQRLGDAPRPRETRAPAHRGGGRAQHGARQLPTRPLHGNGPGFRPHRLDGNGPRNGPRQGAGAGLPLRLRAHLRGVLERRHGMRAEAGKISGGRGFRGPRRDREQV